MVENAVLSRARIGFLAKLKQKKFRQAEGLVVLEGMRLISQLAAYGILPLELYETRNTLPDLGDVLRYSVKRADLDRICDSEHPAAVAALYPIPRAGAIDNFRKAFYFQEISDPGNLGTIFRSAEAFGVDLILLSPNSCEVASPKVIRASLGACYRLPFAYLSIDKALDLGACNIALDMGGDISLKEFQLGTEPHIFYFGSEAHGLSPEIRGKIKNSISIPMQGEMESVNLAISASILAYQLS